MEEKEQQPEQPKIVVTDNIDSTAENVPTRATPLLESFRDFIAKLWNFLQGTMSFADEVDKEATVKMIKSEIQFKGFNIWILIFSIIIASIGLNTNSTAVIIGAMLISPLMGPIMGVGLSLGTNDWSTLVKSVKSLGITVIVSLISSTLYFLITPFGEAGDELLGRTSPELRDVFIAIFGGLAGIMANTRNKATNVIPGVAIATALMPPLCTAGYGIATGSWAFFSGAFYLFLINSVYIALTTFVVIRYLKFPLVHFLDNVKEKKFTRYIVLFSFVLIVPSVYTLYKSYKQNNFETNAREFVEHYFNAREMHRSEINYNGGNPIIEISLIGKAKYDLNDYKIWLNKFNLSADEVQLNVLEDKRIDEVLDKINNQKFEGPQFFQDMYSVNLQQIKILQGEKDSLEKQLNYIQGDTIPFVQISKELKSLFSDVISFEYGIHKTTNFKKIAEIPTFYIQWDRRARYTSSQETKLKNWLKQRLNLNEVKLVSY